jgi:hypothetical protein
VVKSALTWFGVVAALGAASVALLAAVPAGASRPQNVPVRCVGTADHCGATISIAGRARSRVVTVSLTGTNLKPVSLRAIPARSRGSFGIKNPSFRLGGSQFRFTLIVTARNPPRARIVLLFAAGGKPPVLREGRVEAKAVFSVGAGRQVRIRGGGHGTSNCTKDETDETFTTTGNGEVRNFGFYAKGGGRVRTRAVGATSTFT